MTSEQQSAEPVYSHQSNTGGAEVDFIIPPANPFEPLVPVSKFDAGSIKLWIDAADYRRGGMDNGLPMNLSVAFEREGETGTIEYVHVDDEAQAQIDRLQAQGQENAREGQEIINGLLLKNTQANKCINDTLYAYFDHLNRPLWQRVSEFCRDCSVDIGSWFKRNLL